MDKVEKKSSPEFGDPVKAFSFCYDNYPSFSPGKEKKISFAERIAIKNAKVPAVGTYNTENAYKKMSFCSNSITSRRRS